MQFILFIFKNENDIVYFYFLEVKGDKINCKFVYNWVREEEIGFVVVEYVDLYRRESSFKMIISDNQYVFNIYFICQLLC